MCKKLKLINVIQTISADNLRIWSIRFLKPQNFLNQLTINCLLNQVFHKGKENNLYDHLYLLSVNPIEPLWMNWQLLRLRFKCETRKVHSQKCDINCWKGKPPPNVYVDIVEKQKIYFSHQRFSNACKEILILIQMEVFICEVNLLFE